MIPRLKFCIENTESPKLLKILADIAELPEKTQEVLLDAVQAGVFSK